MGGLPIFLRYVEQIGLYGLITGTVSSQILRNRKGLQLQQFIKQIIAFFIDGTNMAISSFDQSKVDEGYASLLECRTDQMASSHQIKRFFGKPSDTFFPLYILPWISFEFAIRILSQVDMGKLSMEYSELIFSSFNKEDSWKNKSTINSRIWCNRRLNLLLLSIFVIIPVELIKLMAFS